jgi:hypothetical protein
MGLKVWETGNVRLGGRDKKDKRMGVSLFPPQILRSHLNVEPSGAPVPSVFNHAFLGLLSSTN